MASSAFAISETPEQAISWDQYYNARGQEKYGSSWIEGSPEHWTADFSNFWTGDKVKWKSEYETYLQNLNNRNEARSIASARQWDKYLSDTQYQRMVDDMKKAGLNPWLAVQSGVSGSSVPQSGKANYENKQAQKQKSTAGRDIAMFMLAAARLIAAL